MTIRQITMIGMCCGFIALLMVTFFETVQELREQEDSPSAVEDQLPAHLLREVLDITRGDLS